MKNIILKYLERTGKIAEFNLFLDLFTHLPKGQFALIKISGETLDFHLDEFTEDIAFLNKLNLFPTIVHGGGATLNKKIKDSKKIDGIRITPKKDISMIIDTFLQIAEKIKSKIESYGGEAEIISDCIECEYLDFDKYAYVGKIIKVNIEKIMKALENNKTPIIPPIGYLKDDNSVLLNINADNVARLVSYELKVKRQIFITETGGILNKNGVIMSFINLSFDEDKSFITEGMLYKLNEIEAMISQNPETSIVITSPKMLLQELFTISGSGTVIKNHIINSEKDINKLDLQKISALIENAFNGRKLVKDYFDEPIKEIFYQKDYEALAIIKEVCGVPYLCKFAVNKLRQSTGLGKALWQKIVSKYPSLIWRSNPQNTINSFYITKGQGMLKKNKWHIFWYNIEEEKLPFIIEKVLQKSETLENTNSE